MLASGFMNVQIAEQYSSPSRVIAVYIVLMEQFLVRRSSLAVARVVAVEYTQAAGQDVCTH